MRVVSVVLPLVGLACAPSTSPVEDTGPVVPSWPEATWNRALPATATEVAAPRGWLDRRLIPPALVIPIIWIVLTLLRGAVVHAYPYGFINVVELGYAMALVNVLVIVALGIGMGGEWASGAASRLPTR